MKFVSFINSNNEERLGIYFNNNIYDLAKKASKLGIELPHTMADMLKSFDTYLLSAKKVEDYIKNDNLIGESQIIKMLAPVPHPTSCRDGYAFRQHVASARRNRGVDMIAEFDQYPIFYFTNHNAVFGEGDISIEKDHLEKLDFELEWAVVIGKKGKNVSSKDADKYIAGFTIMNDWSARTLQMEEMLLNLGPAKGKDFATTIGPWLVTTDELVEFKTETEFGNQYDLEMKAFHNGKQVSLGNTKDMTWTFAEIIERVSYGAEIYPGDVIGSGTVGTGCYMELNGTWAREAKEKGESFTPVWIKPGDSFDLEVTGLGKLTNRVVLSDANVSILEKKKI
ncbi:MAG: fumarylacetoacetate hydrolase family protein [Candidatus Kapabacteria bacterium]|nr:fumarylacetoacetate hydrolase family protein [Candidatus Kapabacteria bacterium]